MPQHPQTPPQRRSWYSLMADRLIALDRIKVGFREYGPGDTLPPDHPDAAAWVESGAAARRPEDYRPPEWVRAKRAAATPGLPGTAVGGEATGEDFVGRVPMTEQRRRYPWA